MNTVLVVPDGVGVRNFLLGPFPRIAAEKGPLYALHNIPDSLLGTYSFELENRVQWQRLIPYRDNPVSFTLRRALHFSHMYWIDSQSMRYHRNLPVNGSWRTRAATRLAKVVGRAAASSQGVQLLDRWHCTAARHLPEVEEYRRLFDEINPSVVFSSHQRPLPVLLPVLAAKSLGIPTVTFIFSWDNLTSKDRIAAPFDHYLVWSAHMRDELLRYYPHISPDRVHVVGTPQFDLYADKSLLLPREEFFAQFGADSSRPLILYTGSDVSTCPEDPQHLRVVMQLVRSGRIRGNPQVMLRPHPCDVAAAPRRLARKNGNPYAAPSLNGSGGRFEEVIRDFPELIHAPPAWVHTEASNWDSVMPLSDDLRFLANVTEHADVNINIASTVTLDFALHDKPVVNIAFDIADPPPFGKPLWEFRYQYEHYRPVVQLGAARFARSPEELAGHLNAYLENPALDRDNRRRLVELEVGGEIGGSSKRIVEVLEQIAG